MTIGPQEPGRLAGQDPEDAEDAAASYNEGIVEPETELAAGGHDDRQVNENDKDLRSTDLDDDDPRS